MYRTHLVDHIFALIIRETLREILRFPLAAKLPVELFERLVITPRMFGHGEFEDTDIGIEKPGEFAFPALQTFDREENGFGAQQNFDRVELITSCAIRVINSSFSSERLRPNPICNSK